MPHLIGFIIFGFIVGLLARALMPGRDYMSLPITALLGIVGSLLAGWLGRVFGWYGPNDNAGFIMSTVGAIVVLFLYHLVMRGRGGGISSSKETRFPNRAA